MANREAILRAVYEADRLHREFDTEASAREGEGRVDVFGMLVARDVPVLFRPLRNLLGAYISEPGKGILITSQRYLRVQRFTAAHELGHEVLGHEASLDGEEVLTRALFQTTSGYDQRELQANAFASRLLTPSWLIVQHMNRQGWTRESFTDPGVVYQLSLRIGSSYLATCYALEEIKAIDSHTSQKLRAFSRKKIKQQLIGLFQPENWHLDVWLITEKDHGTVLEGSRSDLVVFSFKEHASAGYIWQFGDLVDAGLEIRGDERKPMAGEAFIGGVVFRTVIAEPATAHGASGHVTLMESRPWAGSGEPLNSLELDVAFSGPVPVGLLPAQRAAELASA